MLVCQAVLAVKTGIPADNLMIMFHKWGRTYHNSSWYVPCSSASDLTTAEEEAQNPGSTRFRTHMGRNMYIDTAEYEGVYQISVKLITGKTLTLDVTGTDTVTQLKGKIQDKEGIPSYKQRLIYQGRSLEDGAQLRHCMILPDDVLHLICRYYFT